MRAILSPIHVNHGDTGLVVTNCGIDFRSAQ